MHAWALDKQGSAHAYSSDEPGADKKLNLSGAVMFGVSFFNPSYAARPDNTGLALFRYAGHLDLDIIGAYLSVPIDVNLFTDKERPGALLFAPTEFDIITGVTTTWNLGPGRLEGGVRFEHDRPIDQGTFTQTYVDARVRYIYNVPLWEGADLSGWGTFGWFAYNPTYAARPDNSGIALFRYALHAELSVMDDLLSLGVDGIMFTDRQSVALRPSELDFTVEVIGHLDNVELHVAYERDLPIDRGGFVQHFAYALLVFTFDVGAALNKPFLHRGEIHSP